MSITIGFNGAQTNKPGAYSALKVAQLTGFPLSATGTAAILAPADGGPNGLSGPYTQEAIQQAKVLFGSGPIADAFDLLVNPSNDTRIVNGASQIYVYKVNQSTQASLVKSHGTWTSKLYGLKANQTNAAVLASTSEILPTLSFTYAAPVSDASFKARINGGSEVSASILSSDNAAAAAAKIAALDGIAASAVGSVITITVDASTPAGAGASLEIIDGAGTNALTTIGIPSNKIGTLIVSATEAKVQYALKHPSYQDELSAELGGEIVFEIGYQGTSATMTITETLLTTTVAGGAGSSLSLTLANYNNIQELVDYIAAQPGYVCSTSYRAALTSPATILDNVSGIGICSTAALKAGRVKADSNVFASTINANSNIAIYTETTKVGLPTVFATAYFTGGTLGTAANSDFQAGFDAFKGIRINNIAVGIAQDGTDEGYGTYDFDSVAAQAASHAVWAWSTLGKSERQVYMGRWGTKTVLKALLQSKNTPYLQIWGQKVKRTNAAGNLVTMMPWAGACILAGMRSGAPVGEPLTYKYINASGLTQDASWNPKLDYAEMIDAGLTFAEEVDAGGYRIVVDNTTYAKDANFVWNRGSVVSVGGYIAYDLRTILEQQFTGTKAKTGTATAIKNFIIARFADYLDADITVADVTAPKGFKNLSVTVNGNTAVINVTAYPVQGVDFVLPTIYLESAVQSA